VGDIQHRNAPMGKRHPVHDYSVPDAAARMNISVVEADVGRWCKQTDTSPPTFWCLTRVSGGIAWTQLGAGGMTSQQVQQLADAAAAASAAQTTASNASTAATAAQSAASSAQSTASGAASAASTAQSAASAAQSAATALKAPIYLVKDAHSALDNELVLEVADGLSIDLATPGKFIIRGTGGGGGGSGGAPVGASSTVLSADATLTSERALEVDTGLTMDTGTAGKLIIHGPDLSSKADVSAVAAKADAAATATALAAKADASALATTNVNVSANTAALAAKADAAATATALAGKADAAATTTALGGKADTSALATTNANVSANTTAIAAKADAAATTAALAGKADASALSTTNANVSANTTAIAAKADAAAMTAALAAKADVDLSIVTISTNAVTLGTAHRNKQLMCTYAGVVTVTIPKDASANLGSFFCSAVAYGASTTLNVVSETTVGSVDTPTRNVATWSDPSTTPKAITGIPYQPLTFSRMAADSWLITGNYVP
jgi:hypothetical protein